MSHEELAGYRQRFEQIVECAEPGRTRQLAVLMSEMEKEYNIPMLKNDAFNAANPEVIKLYREISLARTLLSQLNNHRKEW